MSPAVNTAVVAEAHKPAEAGADTAEAVDRPAEAEVDIAAEAVDKPAGEGVDIAAAAADRAVPALLRILDKSVVADMVPAVAHTVVAYLMARLTERLMH